MMEQIKPYDKYKYSGVKWVGTIPVHWEIIKLKHLCSITTGNKNTEDKVDNGDYKFFVRSQKIEKINSYTYEGEGILTAGDGVGVGKVFHYVNDKFDFHQRVYLFYAFKQDIYPKFLFQYLRRNLKGELMIYNAKSTVDSVRLPVLKDFIVAKPPLREQIQITRFLDFKLSKIDRFIRKKKQLIKLLNEQKAAIINHAVTKGIDPNAKMKPSGIEWLGDIPEHWEVRKLKYVADFKSGEMITSESISEEGDFPVYGGGGFRGFTTSYTNDGYHVLIGRQGALCGNIKYANGKFWASEHAIVTYLKYDMEIIYLGEILQVANLGRLSQTAAQPGISIGQIRNVGIPVPPTTEQILIVKEIEKETFQISTTISTIEKEIALVEEYRTALIGEAVTGKIDVRDYILPDEEEPADELDVEELETEPENLVAEDEGEYNNR